MNYTNILSFIISLILSYIGIPMIFNMLMKNDTIRQNYKGEGIPISMDYPLYLFK